MKSIVGALFIALLTGCAAPKEKVVAEPVALPSWYMQPPASNATTLYGTGEGANRQAAIDDALTNMIATFGVSVSSRFEVHTIEYQGRNDSFDKQVAQHTSSEVKKIRISDYEVTDIRELGYKRIIVQVQANKKRLLAGMIATADQQLRQYEFAMKRSRTNDELKQLAIVLDALKALQDLPDTLLVMNALDSTADTKALLQRYEQFLDQKKSLLQRIGFALHSDLATLKAPVSKGLSEHAFHMTSNASAQFDIWIHATMNRAESHGFTLARTTLVFETKDHQGTIVASNTLQLTGQSSQGYDIALQNVVERLNERIASEGIENILGWPFRLND